MTIADKRAAALAEIRAVKNNAKRRRLLKEFYLMEAEVARRAENHARDEGRPTHAEPQHE